MLFTLPSSSSEEISYKYIYLLRRFHQFLVYAFILCMCTPICLIHFIYFDTAIPTFPQKIVSASEREPTAEEIREIVVFCPPNGGNQFSDLRWLE